MKVKNSEEKRERSLDASAFYTERDQAIRRCAVSGNHRSRVGHESKSARRRKQGFPFGYLIVTWARGRIGL